MNTFCLKFTNIINIMSNPESYNSEEKNKETVDNSLPNFFLNMNKKKLKSKDMEPIVELLKKIIPSNLNVDYSDLLSYFKYYQKVQSKPVCKCYTQNNSNLDKYQDVDIIKSYDLFINFNCKNCGHFESEHTTCKKYVNTDDSYNCKCCGIRKDLHTICMNYDSIDNYCNYCGFSWLEHRLKYDKMNIDDCGNFISHPENSKRCCNCIYNETHHKYSKKYHALNQKAKDKVADDFFVLTSEFIQMSDSKKIEVCMMYEIITKMLIIQK